MPRVFSERAKNEGSTQPLIAGFPFGINHSIDLSGHHHLLPRLNPANHGWLRSVLHSDPSQKVPSAITADYGALECSTLSEPSSTPDENRQPSPSPNSPLNAASFEGISAASPVYREINRGTGAPSERGDQHKEWSQFNPRTDPSLDQRDG